MGTAPPEILGMEAPVEEPMGGPPPGPPMGPPQGPQGPPEPEVTTFQIGNSVELTDEEKTALRCIRDTITEPDDEIREKMTPIWQMYENYWRGIQDVVYDTDSQSFLSAAGVLKSAGELEDTYIGSKIVNTYRARGESIAAALSTGTPQVKFFPEDADDPQDINTAKAYSKASEYIADDNEAKLLHLRAIYTRWNQPFVAYYNTYVYDEEYGMLEKREYGSSEQDMTEAHCPGCGDELPVQTPNSICPDCGQEAVQETTTETIPAVTKIEEIPKGKEKIEVYGPRHVRIPYNIKKLQQGGYLILETEGHWAQLVSIFPQLQAEVKEGSPAQTSTSDQSRIARRSLEGATPDSDQRTLHRCWFRKWTYELIADENVRASLRVKFPEGVQVTFVDEIFVEAFDESMDEHWTLVPDPFAEHVHGDPMGKPMIPIQDMTNDVVQLTLEKILFGIPDSFGDPTVLNFKKYANSEKSPGSIFQAKRPPGQNLDAGFFQFKPATLGDNESIFRDALDQYGMSTTGDFPGIHGGPLQKGSSRTADEYRQAKQSALQRLGILWFNLGICWAQVMKKAVNELRIHMKFQGEDVKFVEEAGKGFLNVWIKLADIADGEIGRVRPENADTFPLTTEQQRGALLELIQTGNPMLSDFVFSPENIGEMSRILIGLNRFKVPGEEAREQQLQEIHDILIGAPVMVDEMMDDHEMHAITGKSWAAGEDGRKTKEINPQGFQMVVEHVQQHEFILQMMQEQQAAAEAAAAEQGPAPKGGQAQKSGAAESVPPPEG